MKPESKESTEKQWPSLKYPAIQACYTSCVVMCSLILNVGLNHSLYYNWFKTYNLVNKI